MNDHINLSSLREFASRGHFPLEIITSAKYLPFPKTKKEATLFGTAS